MPDQHSGEPGISHSRSFVRSLVEESTVLIVQLTIVALGGLVGYFAGGALGMWLGLLVGFGLAGAAWLGFMAWGITKGAKERRARSGA